MSTPTSTPTSIGARWPVSRLPAHTLTYRDIAMGARAGDVYRLHPHGEDGDAIEGLGKVDTADGDQPRPQEDGILFGRDLFGGRLLTISGSVNCATRADAQLAWAALQRAWSGDEVRLVPGAVQPLTLSIFDGPPGTVFGRPRKLDPIDGGLQYLAQGRVDWIATFQCIDALFYGPEQSITVPIVPPSSSGVRWPQRWPMRWTRTTTTRPGELVVGGDTPAWVQATVHGPQAGAIVTPVVEVIGSGELDGFTGWVWELDTTLPYGQYISIISAPWARSGRLNGVVNAMNTLTPRSRLPKLARIPPGVRQVALRGNDPSGTAWLELAWRDARRTL